MTEPLNFNHGETGDGQFTIHIFFLCMRSESFDIHEQDEETRVWPMLRTRPRPIPGPGPSPFYCRLWKSICMSSPWSIQVHLLRNWRKS